MGEEFLDWLENKEEEFFENVIYCVKSAITWMFFIALMPIWIIPFLYWYFRVWKKGEEDGRKESN